LVALFAVEQVVTEERTGADQSCPA
jgi:hypothetical protein